MQNIKTAQLISSPSELRVPSFGEVLRLLGQAENVDPVRFARSLVGNDRRMGRNKPNQGENECGQRRQADDVCAHLENPSLFSSAIQREQPRVRTYCRDVGRSAAWYHLYRNDP